MHFTSRMSSYQALLNKTTFLEGFFHAAFLFCAPAADGCAMTLPTERLSLHPPAPCCLLLTQFCSTWFKNLLFFPRWSSAALGLSRPPLSEGPLWSSTLESMMEGFPCPGHLTLKHSFSYCWRWGGVRQRKEGDTSPFSFLSLLLLLLSKQLSFLFHEVDDFKGSVWALSCVAEGAWCKFWRGRKNCGPRGKQPVGCRPQASSGLKVLL